MEEEMQPTIHGNEVMIATNAAAPARGDDPDNDVIGDDGARGKTHIA